MAQHALLEENIKKLELNREDRSLVLSTIKDPSRIQKDGWKRLVELLTHKAVSNHQLGRVVAKVCDDIAKSEITSLNDRQEKYFRKYLLTQLQEEYKKHQTQNYSNHKAWIGFVNFLCGIFDILHINNMPLMTLIVPVYEVLGILAEYRFANDDSAIQCLVVQLQFIGEELDRLNKQKMNELIAKLRNLLLCNSVSQFSCLMLLEILELRSGHWKLSPAAFKYYYEDVAK